MGESGLCNYRLLTSVAGKLANCSCAPGLGLLTVPPWPGNLCQNQQCDCYVDCNVDSKLVISSMLSPVSRDDVFMSDPTGT
jgi:hypothetical protein